MYKSYHTLYSSYIYIYLHLCICSYIYMNRKQISFINFHYRDTNIICWQTLDTALQTQNHSTDIISNNIKHFHTSDVRRRTTFQDQRVRRRTSDVRRSKIKGFQKWSQKWSIYTCLLLTRQLITQAFDRLPQELQSMM